MILRKALLFFTVLVFSSSLSKANNAYQQGESSSQSDSLQVQIQAMMEEIQSLKKSQTSLNRELNTVRAEIDKAEAKLQTNLEAGMTKSAKQQASFSEKVSAEIDAYQNRIKVLEDELVAREMEIESVEATANARFNNLLALIIITLLLSPILIWVSSRRNWKKAVTEHQANWNRFQEYILKKK